MEQSDIKIRQKVIMDCVKRFIRKHPREYTLVCQSIKKEKAAKKDDFGLMDKDSAYMRWTLRIPAQLFNLIDKILANPRFLESDIENNWFKKTFPQFRVSSKT